MRRMKDMAAMGGGGMQFYGQMPDNFNVVFTKRNREPRTSIFRDDQPVP